MSNERSAVSPTRHLKPSDAAHQFDKLVQDLEVIRAHLQNGVHAGGLATAPTSASTQLTGASGVTEWRVDVTQALAAVGGVIHELAITADHVIHDTTVLVTAAGQSCMAALVLKNVAGTISLVSVKGTAAALASIVAPTDAEIQTAVGAGNAWVKIAECTINRTADTTVTQSQDNTKRPIPAVTRDSAFGDWSEIAPAS